MIKKYFLKKLSNEELIQEIIKRNFIEVVKSEDTLDDYINFWKECNKNNLLEEFIKFRKSQLLNNLLSVTSEKDRYVIIGALGEWILIENLTKFESSFKNIKYSINSEGDNYLGKLNKVFEKLKESYYEKKAKENIKKNQKNNG